jgi:Icc protein
VFTIAHVSDLHIGGRPEAVERAERVLRHVVAMDPAPDVLLVTGDIADHGELGEYATARELLSAWTGPLLVGTGNHDVREPFAAVLLGSRSNGPLDQVLEVGGHRFLMLDSLVPAVDGVRQDHGSTGSWAPPTGRRSSPSTTRPRPSASSPPTPCSCTTAPTSTRC